MYRSHYSREISKKEYNTTVEVSGWIEDIRNLGSIAFIILRDKKGTLQLTIIKNKNPELFEKITSLSRESVVYVKGQCVENDKVRNNYEILPEYFEILSVAKTPLPLGIVDKVEADFDTRLDNRFIDLRKWKNNAIFTIRNAVLVSIHKYLQSQGFIEIHTPKITASSSEGGTDVFKLKYFEKDAFLVQSPQLYKQTLMASGFDRVYEIAWYFRAEQHNTRRHLNESTAVDLEMAFINNEEEVMHVLENLVYSMWKSASECENELNSLEKEITIPKLPFKRITYDNVITSLQEKKSSIEWGQDLGTDDERLLGEIMKEKGIDFYFITKYPLESKPFYTMPEGDKYSRGFDLACKGVEIASGSQRIHILSLLKVRMEACGLNIKDFKSYLDAFSYGMPPHGGFGFGIERFLMELLDINNIRECILFPRDRTRLTP